MVTIYLKDAKCEIDRDAFWSDEDKDITYKFTSNSLRIEGEHFDARTKLDLTVAEKKSKKQTVTISATFDLHIHAKANTKEFVDRFCGAEIRLIVWPYFREFVSDLSGRMYIPPIILPLSDKKEE